MSGRASATPDAGPPAPETGRSLNRREWLRRISAAAVPLVGGWPIDVTAWGREVHAALEAQGAAPGLDPDTLRLLSVVCERIIPADETPGAGAAGVPRFIDHMLANWYDPPERERVVAGLRELDLQARSRFSGDAISVAESSLDTLLLELDALGAKSWMATVKYLTIWGYYTSEIGVRQELQQGNPPGRYDGCAPYAPRTRSGSPAADAGPDHHRRSHAAE